MFISKKKLKELTTNVSRLTLTCQSICQHKEGVEIVLNENSFRLTKYAKRCKTCGKLWNITEWGKAELDVEILKKKLDKAIKVEELENPCRRTINAQQQAHKQTSKWEIKGE